MEAHTNRRRFLRRGAVGAGGLLAGTALLRPAAAGATTGALQFGTSNDAGGDSTSLTSSTGAFSLTLENTSVSGSALYAKTDNAGNGSSTVYVEHTGTGTGVWVDCFDGRAFHGRAGGSIAAGEIDQQGPGPGVVFSVSNLINTAAACTVSTVGLGRGLTVTLTNPASTEMAIYARTSGTGRALTAYTANDAATGPAAKIQNDGTGHGVEAVSRLGRGGRFSGNVAQIQLVPGTASTHPASGAAGDLYLDRYRRLWLCKGSTNWVQLG